MGFQILSFLCTFKFTQPYVAIGDYSANINSNSPKGYQRNNSDNKAAGVAAHICNLKFY